MRVLSNLYESSEKITGHHRIEETHQPAGRTVFAFHLFLGTLICDNSRHSEEKNRYIVCLLLKRHHEKVTGVDDIFLAGIVIPLIIGNYFKYQWTATLRRKLLLIK